MRAAGIDVLVRGAGPVGCVAAIALRNAGRAVRLVGSETTAPAFRPIVLSYASRLILERIGAWRGLETSAIETIHVSQSGRFGRTVFGAADAGVPALGYLVEYSILLRVLHHAARDLLGADVPEARCVVHAEGAARDAEEKRYSQDAVVASVRFDRPAATTAFERFTPEGPLALLPFGERYALVWSMRPRRAQEIIAMDDARFLEALAAAAGARPGRPLTADARFMQPLVLRTRPSRVEDRAVYIGNAAQTLHPVAGQGLNLGLRDAWDLAEILRDALDPGDAATLARFAARRRLDAAAAVRVTDLLAQAFLRTNPLNAAALTLLDVFPAARRFFARRMIYGPSALP